MKIIQISDCHLFADVNKLGYNDINPYQSLSNVLASVGACQPDLILFTGDISGDASSASYQHFERLLKQTKLTCAWSLIPGNHDNPKALVELFSAEHLWHNSPQVLTNSQWQIHLLNSHHQGTLGYVEGDELDSLEQQLTNHPDKYHLLAVHHHPLPCHSWMDKHEWLNRTDFIELLEKHASVKAVVYGHIHADIETERQGIKYLACPSTCWQWSCEKTFGVSDLAPGFRVINLAENGQITTSVQRLVSS
ncbi:metallophosphoesterase [Paraglaciecola sp. L3A3]|uniref:metallophosphoesterase n=1 Tax=Paraglaciecola sp. L3A3 TaxID=2686358 RepID=UPI00131E9857|nr:metallophosphoesterase [Paraglaciecola sp. L3A3]